MDVPCGGDVVRVQGRGKKGTKKKTHWPRKCTMMADELASSKQL